MKYKLFQIFDTKAEAVAGPILIFPREGPAIRYFQDLLEDKNTPYNKHPNDYVLTEIGTLDEETGLILPRHYEDEHKNMKIQLPEIIATGKEWNQPKYADTHILRDE